MNKARLLELADFVEGLKDKKGSDPSEWPEDLQVQEYPSAQ